MNSVALDKNEIKDGNNFENTNARKDLFQQQLALTSCSHQLQSLFKVARRFSLALKKLNHNSLHEDATKFLILTGESLSFRAILAAFGMMISTYGHKNYENFFFSYCILVTLGFLMIL